MEFDNTDTLKKILTTDWKSTNQISKLAGHSNSVLVTLPILEKLLEHGIIEKMRFDNMTVWRLRQ